MVDQRLLVLKDWGFNIEGLEVVGGGKGLIRYKDKRKHGRFRRRDEKGEYIPMERVIQTRTLIYFMKLHRIFITNNIRPCNVDTTLLADIIAKIFPCSKRTAYDYAKVLTDIDGSYP